jgi:ABC-type sugar transport system ATPase subunit
VVEIAKAMSLSPLVLQLDEPTSALAQHEVEHLFALLHRLRDQGVTMIYISHRLSELQQIADTVTVLRDGEFVGSVGIERASSHVILDMMFGDVEHVVRADSAVRRDTVALAVEHLKIGDLLKDISFELRAGEVLGIAGMLGSGRTELLHAIFGAREFDSGVIRVDGAIVSHPTVARMKSYGIGYASEDRKHAGLVQCLSIHSNLCLSSLRRIAPSGLTRMQREQPYVDKQVKDLGIKVSNADLPVSSLSGGNQQKVVVGNWLNNRPKVMLFDEPGRGVDVHAKQQINQIIWDQAKQGMSSIVVSTELEDLIECCDRILILRGGRIVESIDNKDIDPKRLYAACMAVTETATV